MASLLPTRNSGLFCDIASFCNAQARVQHKIKFFCHVNQVLEQANVLRNGLSVAVPDGEDRTNQCCAHAIGQQGRNLSIYSLRLPGP